MDDFYVSVSTNCGGNRTVKDWLQGIDPIGCNCGKLTHPRVLDVVATWEPKEPLAFVTLYDGDIIRGESISIIQTAVFDCVPIEHFENVFHIGNVEFLEPKKRNSKAFASLVPKNNQLLVDFRGDENFAYHRCRHCDGYKYAYESKGYILSDQVSSSFPIYPGRCGELLVNAPTYEKLSPLNHLKFKFIPVRDTPLDGLPIDLNDVPSSFRREIDYDEIIRRNKMHG